MTLVTKPLVKQTSTTEGTGNILLDGSSSGYADFATALTDADEVVVLVRMSNDWELLRCTWLESSTTLQVDATLITSSYDTSKTDWAAGTKDVTLTDYLDYLIRDDGTGVVRVPASKALGFDDDTGDWQIDVTSNDLRIRETTIGVMCRFDYSSEKIDFPFRVTGVEIDGVIVKVNGTEIKNSALYDSAKQSSDFSTTADRIVRIDGSASTPAISTTLLPEVSFATASVAGTKGIIPAPSAAAYEAALTGGGFRKICESSKETWRTSLAAATVYSHTHSLSKYPDLAYVELECTTADANYVEGDRLQIYPTIGNASNEGLFAWCDATTVDYIIGSSGIAVLNATTGAEATLTLSSWRARAVAVVYLANSIL